MFQRTALQSHNNLIPWWDSNPRSSVLLAESTMYTMPPGQPVPFFASVQFLLSVVSIKASYNPCRVASWYIIFIPKIPFTYVFFPFWFVVRRQIWQPWIHVEWKPKYGYLNLQFYQNLSKTLGAKKNNSSLSIFRCAHQNVRNEWITDWWYDNLKLDCGCRTCHDSVLYRRT
jgi:hypothetical protein